VEHHHDYQIQMARCLENNHRALKVVLGKNLVVVVVVVEVVETKIIYNQDIEKKPLQIY
jgi:hypothetical protein